MTMSAVKSRRKSSVQEGDELDATISLCGELLGWPIAVNTEGVFLPVSKEIGGLTVPAGLAGEVNTEIIRREIRVPIIAAPGVGGRWVFLVQMPPSLPGLPVGVGLISGTTRIPLPPTKVGDEPSRWISRPSDMYRVVVPPASQVLQAIRYTLNPKPI
ncbi:hypothetical protein Lesp01_49860 [Lentzea sp. NBRC 102530]|nr:hypothetical protein Lesp01_49860 [Lentzea sp. NBRC 102530]